jgi:hypothetical protein
MLLNGILFNNKAWHAISEHDIKLLEAVDEHLLRSLVSGHSKTPLEFMYLEGALPIRFLVSCRRMIYHQTLLKRPDDELTKCVYLAPKESPTHCDYYNQVKDDWEMIGEPLNEAAIVVTRALECKSNCKSKYKNDKLLCSICCALPLAAGRTKVATIGPSKVRATSGAT